MNAEDQIYLGVWTNWSRGSTIMGATLTTTKNSGNILIAFTAIFIPFVGSRLWKMLCFASHSCSSKRGAQNAIYHQRQVVLRNSPSADSGLLSLLLLMWAWRRSFPKALTLLSPLLIFALLFIVGFTLAGGYSSQITSATGDEVLLRGDNCRTFNTSVVDWDIQHAASIWLARKLADAANYAQQCYADQGASMLDCNRLVAQSIPTETSNGNAGCPFASDICRDNESNLRLDTGYTDSNDYLGINAPRDQRFFWRKVISCAPLKTEGYTSEHSMGNQTFVRYHYGSRFTADNTLLNYTYSVPDMQSQYAQTETKSPSGLNFRVSAQWFETVDGRIVNETASFVPDHTFNTTSGDITVIFLSGNGVPFAQKSNDAWYRATRRQGTLSFQFTDGSGDAYYPTEAASPLGCVEQYQWCNSKYGIPGGCGPLAGWVEAMAGAFPYFNVTVDDPDHAESASFTGPGNRMEWPALISAQELGTLYAMIQKFGPSALASQTLYKAGVQQGLAQNQWQIDVSHWWNTTLAFHQALFVDSASGNGLTDPILQRVLSPPTNDEQRRVCQSQKIRHSGYTSFSLFGLLFTYILGALLILLSFALDPIMECLHKRRKYKQYEYLEWRTNGALQLHRLAQDELGYGKWSGCTDDVPVTRPGDVLADLDITDIKYPKLHRESSVYEEVKPHETISTNSDAEAGGGEHGSPVASSGDSTLHDSEPEPASNEPQHTSAARDPSTPTPDERIHPEPQRVSVISEEDEGRARTDLHRIAARNTQEGNPSP